MFSEFYEERETISLSGHPFGEKRYDDLHSLIEAMASHWEAGKEHLFGGSMSAWVRSDDADLGAICDQALISFLTFVGDPDRIFWNLLYDLDPYLRRFCWKGRCYDTLSALGEEMLNRLNSHDDSDEPFWDQLLLQRLLSDYAQRRLKGLGDLTESLERMEKAFSADAADPERKRGLYYSLAYLLSGERKLRLGEHCFETPEELSAHMEQLMENSYGEFRTFVDLLIGQDNRLDPQFEAWLAAMGKEDAVTVWKKGHQISPEKSGEE